jgi:hypothetical protein
VSAVPDHDAPARGPKDFSLVLGGPLFQMLRRVHLSDDALGLLRRRVLAAVLVMWAPLMALSALGGGLLDPSLKVSFLTDIGIHLRFLVVAPLLIAAELIVHRELLPIVEQLRVRDLVPPQEQAQLDRAVDRALRLRNSVVAEALLFALVILAATPSALTRYNVMGGNTWYASQTGVTAAGFWLVFVSLPLIQFLLLRWYFRLLIWARFLWRVSRLHLDLNAIHPDKAGGLGFLGESLYALIPISAAHGVLFAGAMADRIFYAGASLTDYEGQVLAGAAFLILLFAGPLLLFSPQMARTKLDGVRRYAALGQRYVRDFRGKWMAGSAPADEPLIGTGDIQSLADLANSYGVAEQMRIVPVRPMTLILFIGSFVAPMLPLALTMVPLNKLLSQLIGMAF